MLFYGASPGPAVLANGVWYGVPRFMEMTGQSLQTPPLPPLQAPSTSGAAGIPQAPVGHRQPTIRDLPPEIRREEQSTVQSPTPAQRGIDQDLRICSGC